MFVSVFLNSIKDAKLDIDGLLVVLTMESIIFEQLIAQWPKISNMMM